MSILNVSKADGLRIYLFSFNVHSLQLKQDYGCLWENYEQLDKVTICKNFIILNPMCFICIFINALAIIYLALSIVSVLVFHFRNGGIVYIQHNLCSFPGF